MINDVYKFSSNEDDQPNRFVIHFASKTTTGINTVADPSVNISGYDEKVTVTFDTPLTQLQA